jgi:hypothetical protein
MKLNVKTTVTFTEADLKTLITEYCAKEYNRTVKSISFNVGMKYEDRPCGSSSPEFRSVDVILGDEITELKKVPPNTIGYHTR